ncbi:hypothetical protein DH2020_037977 [Rehmannia glutinosa]|uniref:COP9 signalosome complex subunit 3 n=1 Tax=Rehmannia glutinosa TaxID=99300 RepID=A0ABR0V128_REHGL
MNPPHQDESKPGPSESRGSLKAPPIRNEEGEILEAMNLNMSSAESLVAQIQGLSGDELTQLHNYLKQIDDLLHTESTRLAPLLDQLDPSIHSLGYLYILISVGFFLSLRPITLCCFVRALFAEDVFREASLFIVDEVGSREACTSAPIMKDQANELVISVARFINVCAAEQIRLAPEKCKHFISVCKRLKDQVMLLEDPMRGVAPLLTAIHKLQLSTEQLTTLHPDFLLLCLLSKCYKKGLSILEDDIFEVTSYDTASDFALHVITLVVTAPMPIISAIAVEAYKNTFWCLSFILDSCPKESKKLLSVYSILLFLVQPYLEFLNSYSTGKVSELETCVQRNKDKFESDKNLGLVKQVVASMYKRNIQRLTQTYLTLSLQDIANTVQLNSPKEAEMHVLQMIQEGEIYATINQKDGMVRFLEDPEQYKTCGMIERVDFSIQRIMMLSKKLTAMNELMSCDPSYLGKVGRDRQRFDLEDFDTVPSKFNI